MKILKSKKAEAERVSATLISEQESLQAIRIDISNNACSKLIDKLNQDLQLLEKDRDFIGSHVEILQAQLEKINGKGAQRGLFSFGGIRQQVLLA